MEPRVGNHSGTKVVAYIDLYSITMLYNTQIGKPLSPRKPALNLITQIEN